MCEDVDWLDLAQDSVQCRQLLKTAIHETGRCTGIALEFYSWRFQFESWPRLQVFVDSLSSFRQILG
jgi:hypothetical protein